MKVNHCNVCKRGCKNGRIYLCTVVFNSVIFSVTHERFFVKKIEANHNDEICNVETFQF